MLLYDLLGHEIKMGLVTLTPEGRRGSVQLLKEKILSVHQYWYSLTLISHSYWKLMPLSKDMEQCFHRNKMMDATTPVAFGSRTLTPSKQNYHSSQTGIPGIEVECH